MFAPLLPKNRYTQQILQGTLMARAGKEPAEDVKRAIRQAIELAGIELQEIHTCQSPGINGRVIHSTANPGGWCHNSPVFELITIVDFNGTISPVQIRCSATEGEPLANLFKAPTLRECQCHLEDLPTTLKEVCVARRYVIDRLEAGEKPPIFDGKWTWDLVRLAFPK